MPFDELADLTMDAGPPMKPCRPLFVLTLLAGWSGALMRAADTAAPVNNPAGAAIASKAENPGIVSDEHGYLKLGFDQLAGYTFVPPAFDPAAAPTTKPPTGEEQIPEAVKSWNGKKAVVTGFMIPVKMEKGLVTEFLLMRNTMACCYGAVPNMNEWVIVKMKKGGVAPLMDVPVQFFGDLKVGAMFENGYMTGLYELECERMGEVQG